MTTFASPHVIEDLRIDQTESVAEQESHYDFYFSSVKAHFSVRIYGDHNGQEFDRTFHCGDLAECDGYGQLGTITDITGGKITFEHDGRTKEMAMDEFIWRNRDLPLLI